MIKKLFGLKNEIPTLWYAFFNEQTPLLSKIILALSVLYVVSPLGWFNPRPIINDVRKEIHPRRNHRHQRRKSRTAKL